MKKTIIGAACILGSAIIMAGMVVAIRLSALMGDTIPSAAPVRGWLPWLFFLIAGIIFVIKGLKEKDN